MSKMRAMVFKKAGAPLELQELPIPSPQKGEVLIHVKACGVCRTDLHIIDGDLPAPKFPLILGHQVVGIVEKLGPEVKNFSVGDRIGVPWLGRSCQTCPFCKSERENLCDHPIYTGYNKNGGYADYCTANAEYCFPIPKNYSDLHAAPLLCAGLIGFRAYRFTEGAKRIGFYGFGSSAHILTQIAAYQKKEVYAFTRKGDIEGQSFAKKLGAIWASGTETVPPKPLDAAIIFAPAGELVPVALKSLAKGGIIVLAGIHMSDIPSFPYSLIWEEKSIKSVANLTRQDGKEFFEIAPKVPVKTEVHSYPLEKANEALSDLRSGKYKGSLVLALNQNSN